MSQGTKSGNGSNASASSQKQLVEERWKDIRSKLKAEWNDLSDQDLAMIDGDSRKLVAMISQKTHQPIGEIEEAIDRIAAQSGGLLSRITQQVSELAGTASRSVSQPAAQVYQQARGLIRRQPINSVATAFGAGLLVGLLTYALACDES